MIINAAKVALKASRKTRIKDPEILPLLKKKWKRASPLTKAGIVSAVVVPKVLPTTIYRVQCTNNVYETCSRSNFK